jgi:hypothetical protein
VSTADISVNKAAVILWRVIYGTKAFLPIMLAQRDGCIVNIPSVFGLVGFPTHSAYNDPSRHPARQAPHHHRAIRQSPVLVAPNVFRSVSTIPEIARSLGIDFAESPTEEVTDA